MTTSLAVDAGSFRRVMGWFATGVTVVASQHGGEVHGMTANAVASVSLDPLLVLVCIGRGTRMAGFIERSAGFSINILSQDQEALSRYFAGSWELRTPPEFRFLAADGGPRLVGALASVGCAVERVVEAGDHVVVLGRVIALHESEQSGEPLLFFGGRYRRASDLEAVPAPDLWGDDAVQIHYGEWADEGAPPPGEDDR